MTEIIDENFSEKKISTLTRIASIANIFAWIVFLVHILLVLFKFLQVQQSYIIQNSNYIHVTVFLEMLIKNPLYTAYFILDLISIFLRGVVFGLLLKGISLGLNMIVEIALNYRVKFKGGNK